jgi:hypothetical protein
VAKKKTGVAEGDSNGMVKLDDAELVKAWQDSSSTAECAEKLGAPLDAVKSRAFSLRKAGVKLKLMRRSPVDVDALNALIEE